MTVYVQMNIICISKMIYNRAVSCHKKMELHVISIQMKTKRGREGEVKGGSAGAMASYPGSL